MVLLYGRNFYTFLKRRVHKPKSLFKIYWFHWVPSRKPRTSRWRRRDFGLRTILHWIRPSDVNRRVWHRILLMFPWRGYVTLHWLLGSQNVVSSGPGFFIGQNSLVLWPFPSLHLLILLITIYNNLLFPLRNGTVKKIGSIVYWKYHLL